MILFMYILFGLVQFGEFENPCHKKIIVYVYSEAIKGRLKIELIGDLGLIIIGHHDFKDVIMCHVK